MPNRIPGMHKIGDITLKRGVINADTFDFVLDQAEEGFPHQTPEWTNASDSDPAHVAVGRPKLLIADEPVSGLLDPESSVAEASWL
ncbi:MAG: hypothetical protein AAF074_02275 [Pseudomonadota bacterium]